jgi:hypothetical protein
MENCEHNQIRIRTKIIKEVYIDIRKDSQRDGLYWGSSDTNYNPVDTKVENETYRCGVCGQETKGKMPG